MRVLAVILTLVVSSCQLHAHHQQATVDFLSRAALPVFKTSQSFPVLHYLKCAQSLGPLKCLSAYGIWRTKRAIEAFGNRSEVKRNLTEDTEQFLWEKYINRSEEQINSDLCDETERLMRYKTLSTTLIPGYKFELGITNNGTLNLDIFKNTNHETSRTSAKKLEKRFYRVLPYLMIPGLIMSAILPFILPALKLMTVGVGMLNNMALTGAIFTLLRNNAFNDRYDNKVVYSNEGYKNEKRMKMDLKNAVLKEFYMKNNENYSHDYIVEDDSPNSDWINYNYEDNEIIKNKDFRILGTATAMKT